MKKILLTVATGLLAMGTSWSQCVPSCSVYGASPITYSVISGLGGTNGYGTQVSLSDDQLSGSFPIGFTFNFYCNNYSNFRISSNGYITFDMVTGANGCCSGLTIPSAAQPNDMIALGWNDWYPPGAGYIAYATTGTAPNRICVITYSMIPHCCSSGPPDNSGQILLYESTNVIEIHSGNITNDGSSCTQGIENASGSLAVPVPGRNGAIWTATNSAYRFIPSEPLPPAAISGQTANICQGAQTNYSVTASPGAISYNWSIPGGWTGTSTTNVIPAVAGQSGTISVSANYSCGTSQATTLTVLTVTAPSITGLSASPQIICSGETVTITGTSNTGVSYTLEPGTIIGTPPFIVTPSSPTSYILIAADNNNCTSVSSPTVVVNVKETPTITVSSGSICLGQSFALNPQGAPQYTISSLFSSVTPPSAGTHTYSVIGTNSTGCVSDMVISTVFVQALPNVSALATRPVICFRESTTLTATGASSYSWSTSGSGESITVTPQGPIIYTVTGTSNGCAKTATVLVDVVACTGIDKFDGQEKIAVYPNPFTGEFNLNTPFPVHTIVYDMLGKIVYDKQLPEGVHKINLSHLPSGKYLIKTNGADYQQSTTIIKQ